MTSYFLHIASKFFSNLPAHVLIYKPIGLYLVPIFTITKGWFSSLSPGLNFEISGISWNELEMPSDRKPVALKQIPTQSHVIV